MSAPRAAAAPWLETLYPALRAALAAGRFPHALLLHADPGTGGEELALWVAALLLCRAEGEPPCGVCLDCRRVREGQHPDFTRVTPLEDSKQIRVDQIRELGGAFALTSHGRGHKVALIAPADALNVNAANALLKTLEEPPARTLIVLLAAQLSRLPATVRSRCQRLRVRPPNRAASLEWLEAERPGVDWSAALDLLGAAPWGARDADVAAFAAVRRDTLESLLALRRGNGDAATIAERWARGDTALHLRAIENWIAERIRRNASAPLSDPPGDLNIRVLFGLLDQTRELVALLDTPLNRALGIENLLRSFEARAPLGNQ
jgi:DNA polymerase-3 subunit delta'